MQYMEMHVSKTTVNDWSRQFHQGRQSTADLARTGRSCVITMPANIAAVEAAVRSSRHLSMKATAANLHISVGTVHSIIQNIGCIRGLCGLWFGIFLFNTVVVYRLTSVKL
jgi:DNA-binding transcriptional regulator YiaG